MSSPMVQSLSCMYNTEGLLGPWTCSCPVRSRSVCIQEGSPPSSTDGRAAGQRDVSWAASVHINCSPCTSHFINTHSARSLCYRPNVLQALFHDPASVSGPSTRLLIPPSETPQTGILWRNLTKKNNNFTYGWVVHEEISDVFVPAGTKSLLVRLMMFVQVKPDNKFKAEALIWKKKPHEWNSSTAEFRGINWAQWPRVTGE